MDAPETVGNWHRDPDDITITKFVPTNGKDLTNIAAVWQNSESDDLLVITDLGVGGDHTIWHIPSKYIESPPSWMKKLRLKTDTADYSYGAVIERAIEEEDIINEAVSYMKKTDELTTD